MATKFDPQLHILRSVARSMEDNRQRQEAKSARFNLFAALEQNDRESALTWLEALEVSLKCAEWSMPAATVASAQRAIAAIRSGL